MKAKSSTAKKPAAAKERKPNAKTSATGRAKTPRKAKAQALTHPRSKAVTSASVANARSAAEIARAEMQHELVALRAHVEAIRRLRGYVELNPAGDVVDCNEVFERYVGYSKAELIGHPVSMVMDAAWQGSAEAREFWARLQRGESVAGRYRMSPRNGAELWLQANFNPMVVEGRVLGIVAYSTDVTEQARQLADLSGQLEALSKSQAVIQFTLDGQIIDANDNFLAAVGYSREEIVGKHHSLFVDPAYRSSAEYKAFWAKLGRGEYESGQYRRYGKDGRELWLQASYNAILDATGKPFKVVKYATDVSEQVHAAQALQRSVEQIRLVVDAAAGGDLGSRVPTADKQGVVLSLCDGINAMLDGMEHSRAKERALAAENTRIRMALDNVTVNVMIADKDREIVYANQSVQRMLQVAESDLRKELPNFDARRIVGSNIDVFHRNPDHQRRMLEGLRETRRATIKVGGRTFLLTVNPINDAAGERIGTVVEWADRTNEVHIESEIGGIVQSAVRGDFTRRISLEGKEGFFHLLAENMNALLETSNTGLNEVARVLSALAQGDLTQTIEGDYQGTFGKLRDDANQTVVQLTEIIGQIKTATDTINVAAREIASGNNDLSARTENQAASLEETASSMEELTSTVKQNAENAKQANQLAMGASDVARKGGQVVSEVVSTMSAINDSSKKIVDIISVIDGIAFQTNILALNAAVEAARAGEQGRGFAVVAAEVRSLAQRSAGAAKEIKTLISDSVEKVGNGSKLVEQAGRTMEEIVTSVKRVTDIMAEITAASMEQSQGIEQVNTTIAQMDEVTQQNAALVEEASAAARSLEEQASGLTMSVAQFRLDESASEAAVPLAPKPAVRTAAAKPVAGKPAAAPLRRPASAPRATKPAAKADDQWTEF